MLAPAAHKLRCVTTKLLMQFLDLNYLQINVCDSGLHAIDHANTRGGSAYAASGVGACQCRHMLVKPNGVGDLQKGEK